MRHYECECLNCHNKQQLSFTDSYPEYGDQFTAHCKCCDEDTLFTRVLTRKTQSELRRKLDEEELKKAIQSSCQERGFTCRFYYESAIITTPAAVWSFNYHDSVKVLRHENRRPVHDDMGGYVKTHEQFRRRMSWQEVIEYIVQHDQWRLSQEGKDHARPDEAVE